MSLDTTHVTMPSGNKNYIVVAIDHFTQWIEVEILTNEKSQSLMNLVERNILMRHRCLSGIQTDGTKTYVSTRINILFTEFNYVYLVAAPYNFKKQHNL